MKKLLWIICALVMLFSVTAFAQSQQGGDTLENAVLIPQENYNVMLEGYDSPERASRFYRVTASQEAIYTFSFMGTEGNMYYEVQKTDGYVLNHGTVDINKTKSFTYHMRAGETLILHANIPWIDSAKYNHYGMKVDVQPVTAPVLYLGGESLFKAVPITEDRLNTVWKAYDYPERLYRFYGVHAEAECDFTTTVYGTESDVQLMLLDENGDTIIEKKCNKNSVLSYTYRVTAGQTVYAQLYIPWIDSSDEHYFNFSFAKTDVNDHFLKRGGEANATATPITADMLATEYTGMDNGNRNMRTYSYTATEDTVLNVATLGITSSSGAEIFDANGNSIVKSEEDAGKKVSVSAEVGRGQTVYFRAYVPYCNEITYFHFSVCDTAHHMAFGFPMVVTEPTCVETGVQGVLCELCGATTQPEEVPAKGHTAGEWTITQDPYCETVGQRTAYCTVCNEIAVQEEIPATGHTPGETRISRDATCETAGLNETYCSVCWEVIAEEEIPALGHIQGEWYITRDASCLATGQREVGCTRCYQVLEQEEIPLAEHKLDRWVDLKYVTCTEEGLRVQRCSVCQADLATETIPALGHTPGNWVDEKRATCADTGLRVQRCSACNADLNTETVAAHGHSASEWYEVAARCEEAGIRQRVCLECGYVIESEAIDALGHTYSDWITTKEATRSEEGEKSRHCIRCGNTQFETIKKKGLFG